MNLTLSGMDLATKITRAAERNGWSQADLRRMVNDRLDVPVSKYVVETWFSGANRPDSTMVLVLSELLGLDLHYLCDDSLDTPPPRSELTEDERMVLRIFRSSGITAEQAVEVMLVKNKGITQRPL